MAQAEIRDWIGSLIGPGKKFRSPRQLSVAAGLSQNTVSNIWQTGRGDPESLGKIADTVGRPRIEASFMAGWLRPSDLDGSITEETARWISLFFALPEDARLALTESAVQLLKPLEARAQSTEQGLTQGHQHLGNL